MIVTTEFPRKMRSKRTGRIWTVFGFEYSGGVKMYIIGGENWPIDQTLMYRASNFEEIENV